MGRLPLLLGGHRAGVPDRPVRRLVPAHHLVAEGVPLMSGSLYRWVSCGRDSSWSVSRFRHLAPPSSDGWITTLCGATGTPGAFRADNRKPCCTKCLMAEVRLTRKVTS